MPFKHPARHQHESRRHPAAFFVHRKHAEKPHRTHDSRRAAPTAAPSAYPTPKRAGTKPSRNADRITDQPTDRRTAGKAAGSPTGREEAPTPAGHRPSRRSPSRSPADAIPAAHHTDRPATEAKHAQPRRDKHERQHDQRQTCPAATIRGGTRRSRPESRPAYQPDRNTTEQPPSGNEASRGEAQRDRPAAQQKTRRTIRPESRRNADREKSQPEKRPERPAAGRQNAPTICPDRKPPQTAAARQRHRSGTQLWTAAGSPEIAMQKTPEHVKRMFIKTSSKIDIFDRPKRSNGNFSSSNRRQMPQLRRPDPAKNTPTFRFAELPLRPIIRFPNISVMVRCA